MNHEKSAMELLHTAFAVDLDTFRGEVLRYLNRVLTFDLGAVTSVPLTRGSATALGFDARLLHSPPMTAAIHEEELWSLSSSANTFGVARGSDGFRERSCPKLLARLSRSEVVKDYLVAKLTRSSRCLGFVLLARTGTMARPYTLRHVKLLAQLEWVLSLGEALYESQALERQLSHKPLQKLTAREDEIVGLMRTGMSNGDIAIACGVSPNTVRNHLASVFAKTGAASRVELVHLLDSARHEPRQSHRATVATRQVLRRPIPARRRTVPYNGHERPLAVDLD